ncbi:hypothetical protein K438DRAFT_1972115 [Mycena galopus ATCC 62051]|nr:hypothetical protein K438DRAFT_1972115 [Mycena galopus ATCC 62051]
MKYSATLVALSLVAFRAEAHKLPSRYAGQRRGNQFVTGPCTTDSDCQQGCCGFSTGKCAGPAVAQSNGSGGCGFGNAAPNCDVATALGLQSQCIKGAKNGNIADPGVQAAAAFAAKLDNIPFTPAAAAPAAAATKAAAAPASAAAPPSIASLAATQSSKLTVFETCSADSACQQGCCGFTSGKCAGPDVAQTNGSGGCGHGNAAPNCDVATLLGFKSQCISGAVQGNLQDSAVQAAAAFAAQLDNLPFTPSAAAPAAAAPAAAAPAAAPAAAAAPPSVASLAASQTSKLTVFEACSADSACQQGCCGFSSGKCAGPAVAQTNGSGGCGHGNAAPNCDVATLLGFKSQCIGGTVQGNLQAPAVQAAAAFAAQLDNLSFTPSK